MGARIMGTCFVAIGALLLCVTAMRVGAATITVTNTNDSGPGSLRQALTIANDGDTITFAVTGTISLTSGGLPVARNVTISGPGADQLSVNGNQALLVLGIFPGKTATISGLSITNGQRGIWNDGTLTVSDCVFSGNSYAGLYNPGTLTVSNCSISGNSGTGLYNDHATSNVSNCIVRRNGAGLYNDASTLSGSDNLTGGGYGRLTVSNCVVTENLYGGLFNNGNLGPNDHPFDRAPLTIADSTISNNSGSGVDNLSGTVTIVNSTLTGNSVGRDPGEGGGIYTHGGKLPGNVTVTNSTISGNSAFYSGGGISSGFSGLTIINSTISGNSTGDPAYGNGGGVSAATVTIMNSTVSGNSAALCGGICGGTVQIGNTILNANPPANIDGTVTSHGCNISSDNGSGHLTCPGDRINTDPMLGPLQNNGGPTFTHALLPRSPAIDAGDPNFTPPPFYDQRGQPFVRVFHGRIDSGSFEAQGRPRPTPVPRPTPH